MSQTRQIWAVANHMAAELDRWLREQENKQLFIRFAPSDLLRLTRLQVWSYRYKIPVYEILSLLLPHLRRSIGTNKRKRYGLGVTVAALTGTGAEKILAEAIVEKYPADEHIAIWREDERQKQLAAELREELGGLDPNPIRGPMGVLDSDSVQNFLQSYGKRIIAKRNRLRVAYSDPKRKQLRYRGNPWL